MVSEGAVVTYGRRKRRAPESDTDDAGYDDKQASPPTPPPSAPTLSGIPKCRQYFLDFGQMDFSCSTCKICGLLYARGHSEDERLHACFHKRFLRGISFKGWQKERIVAKNEKDDGRVILVLPSDPLQHQFKVKDLINIIEKEFGAESGWLFHNRCKVYIYIQLKKVVGCAVAENISQAYQILSNKTPPDVTKIPTGSKKLQMDIRQSLQTNSASNGLASHMVSLRACDVKSEEAAERYTNNNEESSQGRGRALDRGQRTLVFGDVKFQRERIPKERCKRASTTSAESLTLCMKVPVPAVCGIRGLWVSKSERRRGIATKLMDAVRSSFIYGLVLDASQCAFSQPTPDGKLFAARYCMTESYLVYS